MKCQNCTAQVPPQWIHALNSNICPSCGEQIMDDNSKNFLEELREAMKQMICQMPNNDSLAEGLAGWLLSNYNLSKIGSGEPTEFFKKRRSGRGDDYADDEDDLKYNKNNKFQEFYNRAGVRPKNNKLAKLAQQINSIQDDDEDYDDQENIIDSEIIPSTHNQVRRSNRSEAESLINNSLVLSEQDLENLEGLDGELNPYEINELSNLFEESDSDGPVDILSLERMARLQKQQDMLSGKGGPFRR